MSEKPDLSCSWTPSFDFVAFRLTPIEKSTAGGVVVPGQFDENMVGCQAIAVGPGRVLPNGALRKAPVEPGDYFILNVPRNEKGQQIKVFTEFVDDDGHLFHVVSGEYVLLSRHDKPNPRQLDKPLIVVPEAA